MDLGGRPPIYEKTAEGIARLESDIAAYFDKCDNRIEDIVTKDGVQLQVKNPEPYTVAGLAVHLGMTRKCLLDYEKREGFSYTIKRAKTKIEAQVARRSMETPYSTGCIFNLKTNFDYIEAKDKTPDTHLHMDYEKLTKDQQEALIPDIVKKIREEY